MFTSQLKKTTPQFFETLKIGKYSGKERIEFYNFCKRMGNSCFLRNFEHEIKIQDIYAAIWYEGFTMCHDAMVAKQSKEKTQ